MKSKKNLLVSLIVSIFVLGCPKMIPVTGIEFEGGAGAGVSATIRTDATFQIKASVVPSNATNKELLWFSDNEAVATVDATGLVTSKSEGTAIITVKSKENGEFFKTFTITVENGVIVPTSITLNSTLEYLNVGSGFLIVPTVNPNNTTDKRVQFTSLNVEVATVDENGNILAVDAGETTITIVSKVDPNVKIDFTVRVNFGLNASLIQDLALSATGFSWKYNITNEFILNYIKQKYFTVADTITLADIKIKEFNKPKTPCVIEREFVANENFPLDFFNVVHAVSSSPGVTWYKEHNFILTVKGKDIKCTWNSGGNETIVVPEIGTVAFTESNVSVSDITQTSARLTFTDFQTSIVAGVGSGESGAGTCSIIIKNGASTLATIPNQTISNNFSYDLTGLTKMTPYDLSFKIELTLNSGETPTVEANFVKKFKTLPGSVEMKATINVLVSNITQTGAKLTFTDFQTAIVAGVGGGESGAGTCTIIVKNGANTLATISNQTISNSFDYSLTGLTKNTSYSLSFDLTLSLTSEVIPSSASILGQKSLTTAIGDVAFVATDCSILNITASGFTAKFALFKSKIALGVGGDETGNGTTTIIVKDNNNTLGTFSNITIADDLELVVSELTSQTDYVIKFEISLNLTSSNSPIVTANFTKDITTTQILVTGVTILPSNTSVVVGQNVSLVATVQPNTVDQSVIWTSSNTGIASVNNGVVTGVAVGSVSIKATSVADNNFSATASITVTPLLVQSITVGPANQKISIGGKTVQMTATVLPINVADSSVTWSSSDSNIATVNATGLVTSSNTMGTVTIKATANDGSGVIGSVDVVVRRIEEFAPATTRAGLTRYDLVKAFDLVDETDIIFDNTGKTIVANLNEDGEMVVKFPAAQQAGATFVSFALPDTSADYVEIMAKVSTTNSSFVPHLGIEDWHNGIIRNSFGGTPGGGWAFRSNPGNASQADAKYSMFGADKYFSFGFKLVNSADHKYSYNRKNFVTITCSGFPAPFGKNKYKLYLGQDIGGLGNITIEYVAFYKESRLAPLSLESGSDYYNLVKALDFDTTGGYTGTAMNIIDGCLNLTGGTARDVTITDIGDWDCFQIKVKYSGFIPNFDFNSPAGNSNHYTYLRPTSNISVFAPNWASRFIDMASWGGDTNWNIYTVTKKGDTVDFYMNTNIKTGTSGTTLPPFQNDINVWFRRHDAGNIGIIDIEYIAFYKRQ